jgi:NAD(P)H-quinone oxidoreductase subunit 5
MFDPHQIVTVLGLVAVAAPVALLILLGLTSLVDRELSERTIALACHVAIVIGLVSSAVVFVFMLATGERRVKVELGDWVAVDHYHFAVTVVFNRLSVPFTILTFVLCGTVGVFASRYMHRERGYNRFFVLYAMFLAGMVLAILAGTIETLFAGWELVGLSSALLIAFFHERPAPPRNGLRVWVIYRISDAALLMAAVVLHHIAGSGDFDKMFGSDPWPEGRTQLGESQALIVGLLLLVAAAGKSALIPFSGWLPRAMEGPTASSAVFYGALSVHLGAYLLLRAGPLMDASIWLAAAVVALGLMTAVFAYIAGSVQTDIKCALSYASLAQVGLIVAEIGLGWQYIALAHLLGHACLRTMQFLRAPTLLHDYHTMENAIGEHLSPPGGPLGRLLPDRAQLWLYRYALERGHVDMVLVSWVARPIAGLFRWFDRLERRWTDFLTGRASRESDRVAGRDRIDELI